MTLTQKVSHVGDLFLNWDYWGYWGNWDLCDHWGYWVT